MLVRKLFLRVYLILVVAAALLGFLIDYFMQQEASRQQQQHRVQEFTTIFTMLDYQLNSLSEPDATRLIDSIKKELILEINLFEANDLSLSEKDHARLSDGQIVTLRSEYQQHWLKLLPTINRLVMISVERDDQGVVPWSVLFYLVLAIPVLLVLWPLGRDLERLEKSVEAIGEASLSERLKLPASSALNSINKKFNDMADRIQYLVNEQKALTNAISHELKTPLARLKFILASQQMNSLNEVTRTQIGQNVNELDQLISEMLNYAKLEHLDQQLEQQWINIEPWIMSVIEQCQLPTAINFELKSDITRIYCDPHLMARALSNLILNARRYAHSTIQVGFRQRKEECLITVEDDGPGIPEQDRARLFEPFARRESSRDKDSGGVGLGLAIVKQIVNKHQGQIRIAESELGGACFEILIPATSECIAPKADSNH